MNGSFKIVIAGALAAAVTLLVPGISRAAAPAVPTAPRVTGPAGLVFVQTDRLADNAVVVYERAADGRLRMAGTFATDGRGGQLTGSVADHLSSQGSLAYDARDRLLYAVNAGSNTITVFSVRGDRLVRRQVISSGGAFPSSVALHGDLVYVLNAKGGGSVQGYVRHGAFLVRVGSWHRKLGLNPKLTPQFVNAPGQVAFTPGGSKLIVTTKANGSDIDVFAVKPAGGLSAKPVVTADPGNVPFGVAFDAGGHLVVAEAGDNAVATFTVHAGGALTLVHRAITGQQATCWVVGHGALFYASNAGSGSVSGYRDRGSGALTALGNTGTNSGTVDATFAPGGHYLYVQTGLFGVVDEYHVAASGSLVRIGSVRVPNAIGGEGIAAS